MDTSSNGDADGDADVRLRAYEPDDEAALWALKERFERELGALGGEEKSAAYDGKLTAAYERRYREWVTRCTEREPGCVIVAERDDKDRNKTGTGDDGNDWNATGTDVGDEGDANNGTDALAGYVFVLPEVFSLVWDSAVVNELYVREVFRGTGVADTLIGSALDHARGQDLPLRRVVLDVDPGNERARAFYRRHSFENWSEMVAREL